MFGSRSAPDEATLAHDDFFDAWERAALRRRVRKCPVEEVKCETGPFSEFR